MNGERRAENGERRTENGKRRTENGERRTESGKKRAAASLRQPVLFKIRMSEQRLFVFALCLVDHTHNFLLDIQFGAVALSFGCCGANQFAVHVAFAGAGFGARIETCEHCDNAHYQKEFFHNVVLFLKLCSPDVFIRSDRCVRSAKATTRRKRKMSSKPFSHIFVTFRRVFLQQR